MDFPDSKRRRDQELRVGQTTATSTIVTGVPARAMTGVLEEAQDLNNQGIKLLIPALGISPLTPEPRRTLFHLGIDMRMQTLDPVCLKGSSSYAPSLTSK